MLELLLNLAAVGLTVGSLYALYFSGLYPVLMRGHLGHTLMQLHFLLAGFLFFYVVLGVDPSPRPLHPLAAVGILLLTTALHAFFSLALMTTATPLGNRLIRSRKLAPSTSAVPPPGREPSSAG